MDADNALTRCLLDQIYVVTTRTNIPPGCAVATNPKEPTRTAMARRIVSISAPKTPKRPPRGCVAAERRTPCAWTG